MTQEVTPHERARRLLMGVHWTHEEEQRIMRELAAVQRLRAELHGHLQDLGPLPPLGAA